MDWRSRYKITYILKLSKKKVKFFVFCSNRQDSPAFSAVGANCARDLINC